MKNKKSDLLLHPVRLRIILAMGGEDRTTAKLAELLPDVAQASLYRQIGKLFDAGLLEVVNERRSRGVIERTYRLVESEAKINQSEAANISVKTLLSGFVTFTGALIDAMTRYTQHPKAKPSKDPFGYRQVSLWLTKNEAEQMSADMSAVLTRYTRLEKSNKRNRVVMSTIIIPELD